METHGVLSAQMGVVPLGAKTVWRSLPVAEMVRKWLPVPLFLNQRQRALAPSEDLGIRELFGIANIKYARVARGKTIGKVQCHTLGAGLFGALLFFFFWYSFVRFEFSKRSMESNKEQKDKQCLCMSIWNYSLYFFLS